MTARWPSARVDRTDNCFTRPLTGSKASSALSMRFSTLLQLNPIGEDGREIGVNTTSRDTCLRAG